MQIKNKTFYLIIILVSFACVVLGLVIRCSIKKFEFNDINTVSEFMYYPFNDTEYSNGTYLNFKEFESVDYSIFKYIVVGRVFGSREILEGAVLTEIEVSNVLKGNVEGTKIKVYEPIDITNSMICSFDGYNVLKNGKDYILCLNDLKEGVSEYDENNIKIYNYSSPFYGKFPLKYTDDEFKICNINADSKETLEYRDYINCEQIFNNDETKKLYFNEYNKLLNLYRDRR